MKINKITMLIGSALVVLGMASCNDFLDKVPDTRVDINTSPEQVRLLLVDGYMRYNYTIPCEFSTDNVVDNNAPNQNGLRYNLPSYDRMDDEIFRFDDVKSGTGEDSPSSIWEGCYHAIAAANHALEAIAKFEADGRGSEVQALKGEALVIRAFHAFLLTQVFCMPYRGAELSKSIQGIPYPTEPETKVLVHYDRGNLADTYDAIERDLLEGLPLIDDQIYDVPKYHFNRAAANAFAARFYLNKREYDKVLQYCNAAFGGEAVDPSPFMSNIWSQTNLYYLSDFGRYFTNVLQQRNLLCTATYSIAARHFTGGHRYACNGSAKRATIQGPGPSWEKCRWSSSATGETFAMNPCFYACCFINGNQEYGTFFGGPLGEQFEYTDKVAGIGYAHIVYPEFTGEEVLLMRAEAKLFLGDIAGAVADLKVWDDAHQINSAGDDRTVPLTAELINDFYTRYEDSQEFGIAKKIHIDEVCPSDKYSAAGIMPYLQCVQHFRRIEFIHNGKRFFDIKRYGIEITHFIGKTDKVTLQVLDPRWAMQIPTEVLSAGMEPNFRAASPTTDETARAKFSMAN